MNSKFENPEYFYYNSNIVITELEQLSETVSDTSSITADYLVEEPYDYIFEPDHYPTKTASSKVSRLVEEKDGVLIYEHHKNETAKMDLNHFYDINHHLNALFRSISLPKWPGIGFGFEITKTTNNDLVYVSNIEPNSPAEHCLQLGDVLIEVDEMNPVEKFLDLSDLSKYLEGKDNVYLMVIHHSKYEKLKSENVEVRNYCSNCKDIVIVSWNDTNNTNDETKPR